MTGLVAPAPGVDAAEAGTVVADGWFPEISLADVRGQVRLGEGAVTTTRLTAAIEGAMLSALRTLASWRTARVTEGATSLAQVTDQTINGVNVAEMLWQRAIRYHAAAELADGHRDLSATNEGLDRADEKDLTADDYRRMAYHAEADLMSIGADEPAPRNRVSLL